MAGNFETAPFGDGTLVGSGGNVTTNVNTHFGTRDSEDIVGRVKTEGSFEEMYIEYTGDVVSDAAFPLLAPVLPAGSVIKSVTAVVTEAFALGGTTPAIEIGTEGSEATNGFTMTEAQAEAAATYNLTGALSGTWAAPLAAETTVGIALRGTTPTVTSAGKCRIVIRYIAVQP